MILSRDQHYPRIIQFDLALFDVVQQRKTSDNKISAACVMNTTN